VGSFFAPEFQNLQKVFQKMQKMQFGTFQAFVFSWNMFIFAKAKATKNINNLNNVFYEEKKLFVFLSNHPIGLLCRRHAFRM
jgi:hypothetical protein